MTKRNVNEIRKEIIDIFNTYQNDCDIPLESQKTEDTDDADLVSSDRESYVNERTAYYAEHGRKHLFKSFEEWQCGQ